MVWSQVKQYVKANNTTFRNVDVSGLISEEYQKVTPQNWINYINHIKKAEDKMWEVDCLQDDVEALIIRLTSSSSSESSFCQASEETTLVRPSTLGTQIFIEGVQPLDSSDSQ